VLFDLLINYHIKYFIDYGRGFVLRPRS